MSPHLVTLRTLVTGAMGARLVTGPRALGCQTALMRVSERVLGHRDFLAVVCSAMEEDVGEGWEGEAKYDYNTRYITKIGDMMVRDGAVKPCLQFMVTAMMP